MSVRSVIAHPWDVSLAETREIQTQLRRHVLVQPLERLPEVVAGVDVSVGEVRARAAAVLLTYPDLLPLQAATAEMPVSFPYVPGSLTFREGPAALAALERLADRPDLVIFDAHGLAHPRRMGLATHLGILLDIPAIGCAKSRLCGTYVEPDEHKGSWTRLTDGDEVIGAVVRTRDRVRPVFVSVGHRVDLEAAVALVLGCVSKYRLPEPTRWAHRVAGDHSVSVTLQSMRQM